MKTPAPITRTQTPNSPIFEAGDGEFSESRYNSQFRNSEYAPTIFDAQPISGSQPDDFMGRMGQAFVNANKLTQEEVIRIIQVQHRRRIRFGEAAIKLGLLSEEDVHEVLAQQFNYQTIARHGTDNKKKISSRLLISHSPYSAQAESIRRFRSEILLRAGDQSCLVFALVSPNSKEGKSHLCASLAIAFAQLNLKTLLIDANLRKPTQHQLFNVSNKTGLSTMLAGRTLPTLDLSHSITNNLFLLPSGPKPPNPSEILNAPNLADLLEKFKPDVKVIILDTPSTGVGADAQIVAPQAGKAIIVCRKNSTKAEDIRSAYRDMESSSVQILGTFFNVVPDSLSPGVGLFRNWLSRLRKKSPSKD